MAFLQQTVLAGQVWLTAVMTLVAGFPRLECACPGSGRQARCPGPSATAPVRCCCCTNSRGPAGPARGMSCCNQHPGGKSSPTEKSDRLPGPRCKQTVAPANAWTASADNAVVTRDLTPGAVLATPAVLGAGRQDPASRRTPWQTHLLGPPTDRVTLFLHLLI